MRNVITLGGDSLDPSSEYERLIAQHSVYVDEDQMPDSLSDADIQPSPADAQTAVWLSAIATAKRSSEDL